MQFVDSVMVSLQAGDGGDGVVSWRHEKFVDRGGPDGGDGGNGGDVVLQASRNQNTLTKFRFQKELTAESGVAGSKRRKHGRSAQDLVIPVPVGTAVTDESGVLLADLTADGQTAVIARGGRGGFGNAHFISSTRQAPKIAEKGEKGEMLTVQFTLKMIADVGLVGLPNAGKSTLLSIISNARPEIADYPFTTLTPNLGVVDVDGSGLLFADIPGLIEGAAAGKGLGDEFLRHVERTAVLLHLIDAYQSDIVAAYQTIQTELAAYQVDLTQKSQIVALTKVEGLDQSIIDDQLKQLKGVVPRGTQLFAISSQTKQHVPELLRAVRKIVETVRAAAQVTAEAENQGVPVLKLDTEPLAWKVTKQSEHHFLITGRKIEKFAERTDFDSEAGLARLRDIMRKMGIIHELERQHIHPGDKISIASAGDLTY